MLNPISANVDRTLPNFGQLGRYRSIFLTPLKIRKIPCHACNAPGYRLWLLSSSIGSHINLAAHAGRLLRRRAIWRAVFGYLFGPPAQRARQVVYRVVCVHVYCLERHDAAQRSVAWCIHRRISTSLHVVLSLSLSFYVELLV